MRHPRGPPFGPPRLIGCLAFPHSAPHSPMSSHRMVTDSRVFVPIADSPSPPTSLQPGVDFEANDKVEAPSLALHLSSAPPNFYLEKDLTTDSTEIEAVEDEAGDEEDLEEDVPLPPRTFTKAKPLPDRENKFTSTLRRLSTVRKRNKTKRKSAPTKENDYYGESGAEPEAYIPAYAPSDMRPSSTTSRESETEVLTSGYFR